ncbi:MAG TPA: hypothetical protein DEA96_15335 [Leptospiraceae bacterium]|nr:hypothetical protein [Spirochaetaceae bacterium]HBS06340.1 hypothetical protein [Leptospiraceae bacterium]|tara:strand:- start:115268 stop:116362 length:1095 start_codon:yes stop_codon:yes gene_type:complete
MLKMPEPMSRRKKSRGRLWIWFIPLTLIAVAGVFYGQDVFRYFQVRFASDSLLRLQGRTDAYLASYARYSEMVPPASTEDPAENPYFKLQDALYQQIDENRRIIEIIARTEEDLGTMAAWRGRYELYELLLRIQLDSRNLIEFSGRGYLPPLRPSLLEEKSVQSIGFELSRYMRRALAYNPDGSYKSLAHFGVALGDLMYFGRTDPAILEHLHAVNPAELPPELQKEWMWVAAGLYALLGDHEKLKEITDPPATQDSAQTPGEGNPPVNTGIDFLEPYQKQLLLGYARFQARDYMQALYAVRLVKYDPSVPDFYRAEAARMEGEINAKQNGPYFAIPYLQEALRISGDDPFLQERLSAFMPKNR